jgi:hypothetical protein
MATHQWGMEFTSLTTTDFGIFPISSSAFETNHFDFTVFGLCIDGPVPLKEARWDSGMDFEAASP